MNNINATDPADFPVSEDRTPEQLRIRREKRESLLEQGVEPYPVVVNNTHTIPQLREKYSQLSAGEHTGETASISGRIIFVRLTGKLAFTLLQSGGGHSLQAMFSLAEVGEESLQQLKSYADIGDIISVTGEIISSKRGELSILVNTWNFVSKALRPLPVAHKDLSEETRVRNRAVDLIMNDKAREQAIMRPKVLQVLRQALHEREYMEVETPMLHTIPGGAAARPFITHSNALDMDLYLRIAPELFLKRCIVGGLERVFEINRNFRNEGADSTHSPEFAMLETYQAYATYDDTATMIQDIVQKIAAEVTGSTVVTLADGSQYDLGGQWQKVEMYPSLSQSIGEEITPDTSVADLEKLARAHHIDYQGKGYGHGKLVEELWEETYGKYHSEPFFVINFPLETSPLTREHRSIPGVSEKWDLYVRGFELATGYSELVDPVIQRQRFVDQARLASLGDDEAMRLDEEFLTAMEYGMPPTSGTGMGIDRLLMALTGRGIRETILFPLVKPH